MAGQPLSHESNEVTASGEAARRQQRFLAIMPAIEDQARFAFRGIAAERREDLVQETIANAWCCYRRLCEAGKEDLVYPTPLARFAVAQIRAGRRVGHARNVFDVSCAYGRWQHGVRLERLDQYDTDAKCWKKIAVEDKKATPAEVATTRLDFAEWLETLSSRRRRMVDFLVTGESTEALAAMFGLSPGRISQIRRELHDAWVQFQQEGPAPGANAAVA